MNRREWNTSADTFKTDVDEDLLDNQMARFFGLKGAHVQKPVRAI